MIVVGKRCKELPATQEALDAIFGYTGGMDLSGRGLTRGRGPSRVGKSFDGFKPLGPWIETDLDVDQAVCTVRHNGRETAKWQVNKWLFSPADVLVAITKYITIKPGDILMMGTDGVRSPYVRTGDVVEIEVSGIGTLRNRFIQSVDWH